MRKIMIAVVLISMMGLVAVSYSQADELSIRDSLAKLPALKSGVAFNVLDSEWEYTESIELASYKGFNFEAGYTTKDKAVGIVSYDLISAKNLGVTIPILDLLKIEPGIYAGYGRIAIGKSNSEGNNEFSFGPIVEFLDVKW